MDVSAVKRHKPDSPARVIAVINQKGGVGKSTTVVNLSAALGENDRKVLVIDFDPQANTTSGFGVEVGEDDPSVYEILAGEATIEDAVRKTSAEKVFLVPASIDLAGAEIELVNADNREMMLKNALSDYKEQFDYVIIDCPPSLGLITLNALAASNSVLVPIQCEYYALEGVTKLLDTLAMVQARLNPDISIFGVLLTMYDKRTTLSNQVAEEVRKYFGVRVFKTVIPRTVKIAEAPSYGMPVTQYARYNNGSRAYLQLAKEVIRRG